MTGVGMPAGTLLAFKPDRSPTSEAALNFAFLARETFDSEPSVPTTRYHTFAYNVSKLKVEQTD